jgi:hypothetical protein
MSASSNRGGYQAQTTHEVIIKPIRKRKKKRHKIQNKERKKS